MKKFTAFENKLSINLLLNSIRFEQLVFFGVFWSFGRGFYVFLWYENSISAAAIQNVVKSEDSVASVDKAYIGGPCDLKK